MKYVIVTIFGLGFLIGSISAARLPRMLGGENAKIEDFPYIVSLWYFGNYFCAGSIISDKHILTSAHCIPRGEWEQYFKDYLTIHAATSSSDEPGSSYKIKSFHIHPEWKISKDGYVNDIAIFTLKDPILFNKHQQKINLPSRNVQNDQAANLTGWGVTSNLSWEKSKYLQKLQVNLLTNEKCQPLISHNIRQEQLCAVKSAGTGPCRDDGGDPLVSKGELVGIFSFLDSEECDDGTPAVYTNVFAYKGFIESIMKK